MERWARPQTETERAHAAEARDFVADRLAGLGEAWPIDQFDVFLQGSAVNGTAVAGGSDIDVAVVWKGELDEGVPQLHMTGLEATYEQLVNDVWWEFTEAQIGTFAIRTSEFSSVAVDVVPAIRCERDGEVGFVVPGGTSLAMGEFEGWPFRHTAAIEARDRELDGRLRPVVRAIKGLRNFRHTHTGYPEELPSYLLESLAMAAPGSVYTGELSEDVFGLIQWAEDSVSDEERRSSLLTPDGRSEIFAGFQKWNPWVVGGGLVELSYVLESRDAFGA
ncbi:MAG: nucleotidyltransferase domain-containing protein [Thermoleophilia bacterium]|nr:nucleotidyltransferase domain-containing protein [Thermoleophilia bacterium]